MRNRLNNTDKMCLILHIPKDKGLAQMIVWGFIPKIKLSDPINGVQEQNSP